MSVHLLARSGPLRNLYACAAVLAMLLSVLVAAVAHGPSAEAAAASSAKCKTKTTKYQQTKTCVTVKVSGRKFLLVYGSGVKNPKRVRSALHCKSNQSKTMESEVSSKVSAEANFIYGKVNAEVSGRLAEKVTAGYDISVDVKVPPKTTLFCDWGIYYYTFTGKVTTTKCRSYCVKSVSNFRGQAPTRTIWKFSFGK